MAAFVCSEVSETSSASSIPAAKISLQRWCWLLTGREGFGCRDRG